MPALSSNGSMPIISVAPHPREEMLRVVRTPGGMDPVPVMVSQADSLDQLCNKVRSKLLIAAHHQIVALTDQHRCKVDHGFAAISLCTGGFLYVYVKDPEAAADAEKFAIASPQVMAGWQTLMTQHPGLQTMVAAVASDDPKKNADIKRFCKATLHHAVVDPAAVAAAAAPLVAPTDDEGTERDAKRQRKE
jgi:hypothetical protein